MNIKNLKTKYGDVVVTNNINETEVFDDEGKLVDRFEIGLVLRWIPKGTVNPCMKIYPGRFIEDFESDSHLTDFINNSNILY